MRPRRGAILVLAILVLVALEALAAGLLFVATQERLVARAWADHLHVRLAAEAAARSALVHWDNDLEDVLPGGQRPIAGAAGELVEGVAYAATAERLEGRSFLVRGSGERIGAGGRAATAHVGLLVRMQTDAETLAGYPAAVVAHGALVLSGGARLGVADSTACPAAPRPDSALALAANADQLQVRDATLDPPGLGPAPPRSRSAIGALSWSDAARVADTVVGAELYLFSSAAGRVPFIYAPGDLVVTGGQAAAVLVVDGDLTLRPGVRFTGPIVVRGRLIARDARIQGALRIDAARAAAPSEIEGGSIVRDACALLHAHARAPALARPKRIGSRLWIPLR